MLVNAQNDGRYRPPPKPKSISDGRYNPNNDGRYRGGNDGKYVHVDVKYVHDARDGGQYTGDNSKYKPDKNRGGPGGGAGGGSPNGGKPPGSSSSSGSNPVKAATLAKPSTKGKGTGEGGNGWAIIRLEDKVEQDGYHYL